MDMGVKTIVVGNLATLAALAVGSSVVWLFMPYLGTLLWAQLVAFGLRGQRDRMKRPGEASAGAATRLLACVVLGGLALTTLATVGVARDAVSAARAVADISQSTAASAKESRLPLWVQQTVDETWATAKPKLLEAVDPYLDGLPALLNIGDKGSMTWSAKEAPCCAIRADAVVAAAGLAGGKYESMAHQAIDFANAKLAALNKEASAVAPSMDGKAAALQEATRKLKEELEADDSLKEAAKTAALQALAILANSSAYVFGALGSVLAAIASSISTVVAAILFALAVFTQLQADADYITLAIRAPFGGDAAAAEGGCRKRTAAAAARDAERTLQVVCEALIIAPVFRGAAFAAATFVLVLLSTAGGATTAAIIAFVAGVLPFIPAFLSSVPWALGLALQGFYGRAVALVVAHTVALTVITDKFSTVLADKLKLPSTIISLSYVLGVQRMGTTGLILGPLLCAVAVVMVKAGTAATSSDENAEEGPSNNAAAAKPTAKPAEKRRSMFGLGGRK